MGVRWRVSFRERGEKLGVLNLFEEGYTGEVVELTPAAVPFETEEATDEDMLKPVRYQTGYIRVLDENNLDGLMPKNLTDRYVEYTEDGVLVWRGYMQPNTLSEPWDVQPIEVEFPVISPIGVLEGKYLDSGASMGVVTFAALVIEVMETIGTEYRDVYVPNEWRGAADDDRVILGGLGVSRFNFFTDADEEEGESWYDLESIPCLNVLEELCKFFGWTVYERGDVLYFVSRRARSYARLTWNEFVSVSYGQQVEGYGTEEPKAYELGSLELGGSSHTKSILPGYKKVTIKAEVNPVDDAVPNITDDQMEFVGTVRYEGKGVADMALNSYTPKIEQTRMFESVANNVELRMYRYDVNASVWKPELYDAEESRDLVSADYVDYDAFTEAELREKKSYNFRKALRVTSYDQVRKFYPDLTTLKGMPVAIVRGKRSANYQNGAFVISATIGESSLGAFAEFSLNVKLKVGNLYWGGSGWTNAATVFEVPIDIEGKKIKNTKELDMPYNGADGYIIPIDRALSGEVELTIYPLLYGNLAFLDNLEVSYYGDDNVTDSTKDGETNRYYKKTDVPFMEEKEVTMKLATSNKNKAGYGLVTWLGEKVEELWSVVDGEQKRPERYLLEAMSAIYGRTTDKLEVELERNGMRPIDLIEWHGREYMPIAVSMDWSSEVSVVVMEDIPF